MESREKNLEIKKSTEIQRIKNGDRCPGCGLSNSNAGIISVIDREGKIQRIIGLSCKCGVTYLTNKLYKKIPVKSRYNFVSSNRLHSDPTIGVRCIPVSYFKAMLNTNNNNFEKAVEIKNIEKCCKCGSSNLFLNSRLCWDCYKYEKQYMYE